MLNPKNQNQSRNRIGLAGLLGVLALLSLPAGSLAVAQKSDELALGAVAFSRGQAAQAIEHWSRALNEAVSAGDTDTRAMILARRAEAQQALGYLAKAIADVDAALALVGTDAPPARLARLQGTLGNLYTLAGRRQEAGEAFDLALSYARAAGDRRLEARTFNNIGTLLSAEKQHAEARDVYAQSAALAADSGDPELRWTAIVNAAYAGLESGEWEPSTADLDMAIEGFGGLPDSARKANGLISLGRLMLDLEAKSRQSRPDRRRMAYRALDQALRTAERIDDQRAQAYAVGYLGQLYEREQRLEEALQLTRQALFIAQRLNAPEIAYLWEWQIGRIKKSQGELEAAIAAYQASIAALRSIRADMLVSLGSAQLSFQDSVQPVILGLADLLLQFSDRIEAPQDQQVALREARQTVELLKAAELEDYFHDNCIAALQAKEQTIDEIAPHTAALYPIILPDRIELLLSLPDGLSRTTVAVGAETVRPVILDFRRKLEKRTTRQYLQPAQRLHRWLIEPITRRLEAADVGTLVVVPSGLLSTVPFAALHDGQQHLVERMALAVAPGLTLIEPRPLEPEQAEVLAGGLSVSVQDFPPLPHVETELRNLQSMFESTLFKNEAFTVPSIQRQLQTKPYTIVHVASHAQIERDPKDSFILTYDGRLTMDGLERFIKLSRFREKPIELLTLSACSTAAGDERAALGLAGIAIKAGARTALASLWFINDESTSILVSRFYEQLGQRDTSMAQALRHAQLSLLAEHRTRHPGYWAPFLLIGNWL